MARYEVKRQVLVKQWVVVHVEVPDHLLKSGDQELINDYVATYVHLNAGALCWDTSEEDARRNSYSVKNLDNPVSHINVYLGDT
jgi:hypothetical protein